MVPITVTGIILFFALVPPGLVWRSVAVRRVPSSSTESIDFALLVTAGAVASLFGATILSLAAESTNLLIDPELLASANNPQQFLAQRIPATALTLSIWVLISCVVAYAGARFVYRRSPSTLLPHATVWNQVLRISRGSDQAMIAVHMVDGSIFEGALDAFPVDRDGDDFTISLKAPMFIRSTDSNERLPMRNLDRLVVQGQRISHVGVIYWDGTAVSEGSD